MKGAHAAVLEALQFTPSNAHCLQGVRDRPGDERDLAKLRCSHGDNLTSRLLHPIDEDVAAPRSARKLPELVLGDRITIRVANREQARSCQRLIGHGVDV